MYHRCRFLWTWLVPVGLVVFAGTLLTSGCRTAPAVEPEVSLEGKTDAEILYDAILVEFEQRDLDVDSASRQFMVVSSTFHPVADRLRRRFTVRIVRLPGGANALRVTAEHQRRHGTGKSAEWKKVDSTGVKQRAEEAELKLGRAIEKRFRRWKEYLQSREGK